MPGAAPDQAEAYVYPPHLPPWLGLASTQRIGRGLPEVIPAPLGIRAAVGSAWPPLRAPMIWQLPPSGEAGDDTALAAIAGSDDRGQAVELIDVDAGVVRWRVYEPAGAIVGVTATAIVGAAGGTWALDRDGASLWQSESPFVAMADAVVVVAVAERGVTLLAADTGRELLRAALPAPHQASEVRWACAAERDLLLVDDHNELHRVVADREGEARLAWTAEPAVLSVEGCGDPLAATPPEGGGRYAVLLLDRRTGKVKARVPEVLGHWRQPDGSIAIAGRDGLRSWDPELRHSRLLTAVALGGKLATWRDRTLVRAEQRLAVIDDRGHVQPFAAVADSAALGARALVTSVHSRSVAHTVVRAALPELPPTVGPGWRREPRPVLPPADLIALAGDLAGAHAIKLPAARAVELPGSGEVGLVLGTGADVVAALRTRDGTALARLHPAGAQAGAQVQVRWTVPRACGGESISALAASDTLVLCAAAAGGRGPLVATDLATGAARWTRELVVDQVQVVGQVVLARGADQATILRARDGFEVATYHSDDGGAVRAALIDVGGTSLLVQREGDAVVARWPLAGMIPVWSVAVDGAVQEVLADGDHALVVLAAGEVYSLRGRDGEAAAIAGEAQRWFSIGEGLLGLTQDAVPGSSPPVTQIALYERHGALRWAYDVVLPGQLEVMASPNPGASAVLFGEMLDRALQLTATGLGDQLQLPESAQAATWVRPLTGAADGGRWWGGVSSAAPRLWVF